MHSLLYKDRHYCGNKHLKWNGFSVISAKPEVELRPLFSSPQLLKQFRSNLIYMDNSLSS